MSVSLKEGLSDFLLPVEPVDNSSRLPIDAKGNSRRVSTLPV